MNVPNRFIKIWVSGKEFYASRDVLLGKRCVPELEHTYFSGQLNGQFSDSVSNENTTIYLDRSPVSFEYVLEYLRGYPINEETLTPHIKALLMCDAEYYNMPGLLKILTGTSSVHSYSKELWGGFTIKDWKKHDDHVSIELNTNEDHYIEFAPVQMRVCSEDFTSKIPAVYILRADIKAVRGSGFGWDIRSLVEKLRETKGFMKIIRCNTALLSELSTPGSSGESVDLLRTMYYYDSNGCPTLYGLMIESKHARDVRVIDVMGNDITTDIGMDALLFKSYAAKIYAKVTSVTIHGKFWYINWSVPRVVIIGERE